MKFIIKNIFYLILLNFSYYINLSAYLQFDNPPDILNIMRLILPENPIVVEAGAFDGGDTIKMATYWPNGIIYAFEPVPEIYERLCRNIQHLPNVFSYQLAIGDKSGMVDFYLSSWIGTPTITSQSSSLLPPKEHLIYDAGVLFNRKITVPIATLDDWAEEHNITHVDFMWLDMQGSELHMLKACPKILKTVSAILTEIEFVEAYEGQYLFDDVKNWLESQGFEMVAVSKYVAEKSAWFGDVLFLRNKYKKILPSFFKKSWNL